MTNSEEIENTEVYPRVDGACCLLFLQSGEVVITLTDDMTVKITDNAQVLDDTVFV